VLNIQPNRFNASDIALFIFALLFALVIQGAIPFILLPTLGQAVWTTGFSQSFLNDSIFSIYARNMGAPEPSAIAFGLAGAWLAAVFMKLGLHASDAYSAMIAVWMTVAFFSAFGIARSFSVHRKLAILAAFSWLVMPITWGHADYSMLSTGIALLPCYFLFAFKIFIWKTEKITQLSKQRKIWFLLYPVICIISIFMDGYSFMMFAVGASILSVWMFVSSDEKIRKYLALHSFPVHLISLFLAYSLYSIYIGKPEYKAAPIDFFRGWGVDLTFLLMPSEEIHWLPDLIGWSIPRSENRFFGDASVWRTSFSLPIILSSVWAAWNVSERKGIFTVLILITVFGFYMSLGPSFKFNSIKPEGGNLGVLMAEQYALAPTGSSVLSENIPGFKNMRASYRWGALGVWGAWVLLVFAMSAKNNKRVVVRAAVLVGMVTLFNFPHLSNSWKKNVEYRIMFTKLESDLIDDMRQAIHQGERVAFVPWRNDFLVNYAAATLKVYAYNIGGDKNLEAARQHWPVTMRSFPMGQADDEFSSRVLLMLARNEADAVIIPYIDMLLAAHQWPSPAEFKDRLAPIIADLSQSQFLEVDNREFYAVVRLKPVFLNDAQFGRLGIKVAETNCLPPVCIKRSSFNTSTPSLVGIVKDAKLYSDGRAGFMLFGPYVPMDAGQYTLQVFGSVNLPSSVWVDVVSSKGAIQHGKFALSQETQQGHILVKGRVKIEKEAQDVEVRVYVGADDEIILNGYELVPVNEEN
jgi:hypothetical protein